MPPLLRGAAAGVGILGPVFAGVGTYPNETGPHGMYGPPGGREGVRREDPLQAAPASRPSSEPSRREPRVR